MNCHWWRHSPKWYKFSSFMSLSRCSDSLSLVLVHRLVHAADNMCMNFFNFVKKLFIFYYFRGHFSRFSQIQWHCRWLRLGVKRGGLELGFGYAFVCSVDHWDMNVSLCVDVCLCWLWLWLHDHHLHSASTFLWTLLIWTLSLGHLSLCFLPVIPSLHRLCSVISVACFLINL